MSDAVLVKNAEGIYDFTIAENGDINQADFFDTSMLVSILERARASSSEVELPELREGWIGNISTPGFERGSKVWLYSQSRLNREVINNIETAANDALAWLIDQSYAVDVASDVDLKNGKVFLIIKVQRPNSVTISSELFLWDNSGVTEG